MPYTQMAQQVLYNCDVSDARHAGLFSVCGLALRLRDLYKWVRRLPPWQEDSSELVLAWIGQKEEAWESLIEADYRELSIDGRCFDPFDTPAINDLLVQQGLFYGAGYAHSLKPTFFLAEIAGRDFIQDKTVWYLGREHARDLLTLPAFTQNDQVVLRMEAAHMFVWDQITYIGNGGRPALAYALNACCGLTDAHPQSLRAHLDRIVKVQQTLFIRHEIGELAETVFDRPTWRQLLADYPHTAVELLARTLKDMLADSGPKGTLSYLIRHQNRAGLGFYIAFCQGLTLALFGELRTAFAAFMAQPDWESLRQAVEAAYRTAVDYSQEVLAICRAGQERRDPAWVKERIEATLRQRGVIGALNQSAT